MSAKSDFLTAVTATTKIGSTKAFSAPNTTTEAVTATGHGKSSGFGPVRLAVSTAEGDALPTGLSASTDYYLIVVDENTVKFATSYANAVAATPVPVNITAVGQGTFTMSATMQTLADYIQAELDNCLTFPGNRDTDKVSNQLKFWAAAVLACTF